MRLDGFRELLIKKSGDSSLENLISFIRDDVLTDIVLESLEKMARSKHKGDSANVPVKEFATMMDPEKEPAMIHDALSHHASHYKAALAAGNQNVANQHANQIFRTMDLADQAQKHSNGKLHVEAVSPHAWERNGKTATFTKESKPVVAGNKRPGQFVTDTKGWRYRDTGKGFDFLKQAPHSHYSDETRRHGHAGAYPLEDIRVNGKYLDIKDVPKEDVKKYEEHPFDKHPIVDDSKGKSHFEKPSSGRTAEDDDKWRSELKAYHSSPHMDKYFENLDENPERGNEKSKAVHEGVAESSPAQEEAQPEEAATTEDKAAEQDKVLAALPPELREKWAKRLKDGQ